MAEHKKLSKRSKKSDTDKEDRSKSTGEAEETPKIEYSSVNLTGSEGIIAGAPQSIQFQWPHDLRLPSGLGYTYIPAIQSNITASAAIPSQYYWAGNIGDLKLTTPIKLGEDLEDKISELKLENKKLKQEVIDKSEALTKNAIQIDELNETNVQLKKNEEEMSQQQRLQHIFYRVHPLAWEKLKSDKEFIQSFEQKTPCTAVIMAIDIRRSTELMLRAKDPEGYQEFIISLCDKLRQIILDNCGVFDKFTGDGILTFFPHFYSGEDAAMLAIKAAAQCHDFFYQHYRANRSIFTTVLNDVGLGIGIDYGEAHLVNIRDWLTVIGTPVVYACRLSSVKSGYTLLNQQAYDVVNKRFARYVKLQEYILEIKHEGDILAYVATTTNESPIINLPDWLQQYGSDRD